MFNTFVPESLTPGLVVQDDGRGGTYDMLYKKFIVSFITPYYFGTSISENYDDKCWYRCSDTSTHLELLGNITVQFKTKNIGPIIMKSMKIDMTNAVSTINVVVSRDRYYGANEDIRTTMKKRENYEEELPDIILTEKKIHIVEFDKDTLDRIRVTNNTTISKNDALTRFGTGVSVREVGTDVVTMSDVQLETITDVYSFLDQNNRVGRDNQTEIEKNQINIRNAQNALESDYGPIIEYPRLGQSKVLCYDDTAIVLGVPWQTLYDPYFKIYGKFEFQKNPDMFYLKNGSEPYSITLESYDQQIFKLHYAKLHMKGNGKLEISNDEGIFYTLDQPTYQDYGREIYFGSFQNKIEIRVQKDNNTGLYPEVKLEKVQIKPYRDHFEPNYLKVYSPSDTQVSGTYEQIPVIFQDIFKNSTSPSYMANGFSTSSYKLNALYVNDRTNPKSYILIKSTINDSQYEVHVISKNNDVEPFTNIPWLLATGGGDNIFPIQRNQLGWQDTNLTTYDISPVQSLGQDIEYKYYNMSSDVGIQVPELKVGSWTIKPDEKNRLRVMPQGGYVNNTLMLDPTIGFIKTNGIQATHGISNIFDREPGDDQTHCSIQPGLNESQSFIYCYDKDGKLISTKSLGQ
eukprot:Pgem_evm1s17814